MVAHILPATPPPPGPGVGSKGQHSTFSENGHDAFQNKGHHECSNKVSDTLPTFPRPCIRNQKVNFKFFRPQSCCISN